MKLICFSNQTGGGILGDLLNGAESSRYNKYHTLSDAHRAFKTGDDMGVYRKFNEDLWLDKLEKLENLYAKNVVTPDMYFGTHCHPSCIPNKYLNMFDKIIAITTETTNSKILRFVRMYHGIFKLLGGRWDGPPENYQVQDDNFYFTTKVDDIRQFCRWASIPFESNANCTNIEFEDIINGKFINENKLNNRVFETWKEKNSFMYEPINPFLLNIFSETSEEIATYEKFHRKLSGK